MKHYSKENLMDANNGKTKRKYENPMPVTDEGWWESVLAEERQYMPARSSHGMPKPKSILESQGWTTAQGSAGADRLEDGQRVVLK
jgi:hypothetical protein